MDDRDERLVEFVRHFHGCEDREIEVGRRLHALCIAVLDGNQSLAAELATEGLALMNELQVHADEAGLDH